MTYALILSAGQFEDIQLTYAHHRLREDAILVDVASPGGGTIVGENGASKTDSLPIESLEREYDLVVVPGGEAAERLRRHEPTIEYVQERSATGGITAAVGRGVEVLLNAGVLDERVVATPLDLDAETEDAPAIWTDEAVVVDGSLVTAEDTSCLPFFLAAAINNVVVPQRPAAKARERPSWEATN